MGLITSYQIRKQREENIRKNTSFLNYASRRLMISVRENAGFGVERIRRLNENAVELGRSYIERYSDDGYNESDADYAVNSYYALRRELRDIGWDPEAELWQTKPFVRPRMGFPTSIRKIQDNYVWYANQMSFYVREMLCMSALELHQTNGFGVERLNRVFHPIRDDWFRLMRIYITMNEEDTDAEKKRILGRFNELGIFEKEEDL